MVDGPNINVLCRASHSNFPIFEHSSDNRQEWIDVLK